MKQTPRSFINHYREPSPVYLTARSAIVRCDQSAAPVVPERITQWVERLKVWTLVLGAAGLFCYGFSYASTWATNWINGAEAAREVEVGQSIRAEQVAREPWGSPVIGRRYHSPLLKEYGLPTELLFRGWVDKSEDLPSKGNQIGDFYRVKSNKEHIWVWAGSMLSLGWVDP
jgi:hypothetical protein